MPDTPKKIEELLRARAKKRRDELGAEFELHPATRKLLQGEVARQFPKPPDADKHSPFFFSQWTWGWAVPMVAVLAAGSWLLWRSQVSKPQQVALLQESETRNLGASRDKARPDLATDRAAGESLLSQPQPTTERPAPTAVADAAQQLPAPSTPLSVQKKKDEQGNLGTKLDALTRADVGIGVADLSNTVALRLERKLEEDIASNAPRPKEEAYFFKQGSSPTQPGSAGAVADPATRPKSNILPLPELGPASLQARADDSLSIEAAKNAAPSIAAPPAGVDARKDREAGSFATAFTLTNSLARAPAQLPGEGASAGARAITAASLPVPQAQPAEDGAAPAKLKNTLADQPGDVPDADKQLSLAKTEAQSSSERYRLQQRPSDSERKLSEKPAGPAQLYITDKAGEESSLWERQDSRAVLLNRFEFKKRGNQVQIVDFDGSAYNGTVADQPLSEPAAANVSRAMKPTFGGVTKKADQQSATSPGQAEPVEVLSFQVAGTNQTLNELITINGRWVSSPQASSLSNEALKSETRRLARPSSSSSSNTGKVDTSAATAAGQNMRIEGTLQVGRQNEQPLEAVPANR